MIHRLTIIWLFVLLAKVLSQGDEEGNLGQGPLILLVVGLTIGILVFAVCFGVIIICGCELCRKKSKPKKKSKRQTREDIERSEQAENVLGMAIDIFSIFESGQWSSRYCWYGSFHGPFLQGIIFNIDQNTLAGNGTDDIGQFTLTGTISTEFLTINMIKKYHSKFDNANRQLGHEAKIDLEWNTKKNTFEGQWFVHTHKYKYEGAYELVKVQQSFINIDRHYNHI